MEPYSIWLLEYGYCATQPVSALLYSKHNLGVRTIPFSFLVVKGNGRTIAIDTGYQDIGYGHELSVKFDITEIRSIESTLADIGLRGEDFDTVILTHAHYDHMGGLDVFPNAHFYIQKKELLDWIEVMARGKEYGFLTAALDPNDVQKAIKLAGEKKLTLLDGAVDQLFPGISVVPVFESHSYGHQLVTIQRSDDPADCWVFTGDACYSYENFGPADGSGPYLPVGFGVGSITGMIDALVTIRKCAGGDNGRLIIPHDAGMWTAFPTAERGTMHFAEIQLAPGEQSRL